MRGGWILCKETARHPFRASLPPHVYEICDEDITPSLMERSAAWWQLHRSDIRSFSTSFTVCFIVVSLFIL